MQALNIARCNYLPYILFYSILLDYQSLYGHEAKTSLAYLHGICLGGEVDIGAEVAEEDAVGDGGGGGGTKRRWEVGELAENFDFTLDWSLLVVVPGEFREGGEGVVVHGRGSVEADLALWSLAGHFGDGRELAAEFYLVLDGFLHGDLGCSGSGHPGAEVSVGHVVCDAKGLGVIITVGVCGDGGGGGVGRMFSVQDVGEVITVVTVFQAWFPVDVLDPFVNDVGGNDG